MVLYVVFLGLLFQSVVYCASSGLPSPRMDVQARIYASRSPLQQSVMHLADQAYAANDYGAISPECLVQAALVSEPTDHGCFGVVARSCKGLSKSSAELLEKYPDEKNILFLLAQAIKDGDRAQKVPKYLNKREGIQHVWETPESYVARILSSESRLRASSEPVAFSAHGARAASPVARPASVTVVQAPKRVVSFAPEPIYRETLPGFSPARPLSSAAISSDRFTTPVPFYGSGVAEDITDVCFPGDGLARSGSRLQ